MSPGRFGTLLRHDLEVSKKKFWACIRSGRPVQRPVARDEPAVVEHDAWVIAVLVGELPMSPEELGALSREEAEAHRAVP
jgi:hypothetical protein